ncbi:MAG: NAD(P)/FAD-dependent oxidoreductase [Phycisphaerales bacterium]|nr:NAD(P)/FAD-dependent oxidoreductase [Phycisphaerales bacterium]
MKHVIIVGGGFAGLNAAKKLGGAADVRVTLVDRQNYHLFQPLLYQVAMAGLSPADIAAPIRSLLARYENISVLQGTVQSVDLQAGTVSADFGSLEFDYLLLCCGAVPTYFGHAEWEPYAPSLKTVPQATEIRRRLLSAFEAAERTDDSERRRQLLTFVVIGGGPTGVELAGAIGEMSRFTLARDFRNIDAKLTRVMLIEAGPRILPSFSERLAGRATRDLEKLGVQIWPNSFVTRIDENGIEIGSERIRAATILWAAGVRGVELAQQDGFELDRQGRVVVNGDLSIEGHANVFVAGDQASFTQRTGKPLPGIAPVAMQQGRFVAATILRDLAGKPRQAFRFVDRGQMATIGRSRAIVEIGKLRFCGWFAWVTWLVVHIYFLVGFKNRLFVVLNWAWSYMTFRRGARLIVEREWQFGKTKSDDKEPI